MNKMSAEEVVETLRRSAEGFKGLALSNPEGWYGGYRTGILDVAEMIEKHLIEKGKNQ